MPNKLHVSQEFEEAFGTNSCGCVRTCDCGIVHWDTSDGIGWEEGELESLVARMESESEKCVPRDCSVGTYRIAGKEYVMGCQCDAGARYEKFICDHARQIAAYLNVRAAAMEKEASMTKVKEML